MERKKTIIGVDPGITSAVAILSLRGKLISIKSEKNFGKNKIIKYISSEGSPTIVATDRCLPSSIVEKISSTFNSILYSPKENLSRKEKLKLIKNYELENSHQKDALAAAMSAYLFYKDQIKKVERTIDSLNLWSYENEVKDILIRGDARNVEDAIERVLSKRAKLKEEKIITTLKNQLNKLKKEIEKLKKENNRVKKRLKRVRYHGNH